ncbi:iron ABC transporter permease [Klugiella xanthotipulae]|uniref:Iron complex transport system permease protein n=1 Tax=Klugiella xanthotipulae TaxID=244735 RepID=A0A543HH74_9MICO|nr:iron ABC transporter permease [Klugiella xanthotipulae]TQM57673.1 iron complex transport system permease protein [Klugiella xanthotipulae]
MRRTLLYSGLTVAFVLIVLVSAGAGQLSISPLEVFGAIMHRIGLDLGPVPASATAETALWTVRFPRIVMAALIGAALSAAGLLMQAIFGNPLAEPGVVGVSSGAALGASATIVFGWTFLGGWTIAVTAFIAGLIATLLVYVMSRANGKTEVVTLVLTGIAVNAFAGAGLAFLTFLGTAASREQIVFWQLGSLNGSRWDQVLIILPLVVAGIIAAVIVSRRLDLLSLGERSARHLGVNVEVLRVFVIVVVALLVGASVAFAGVIAFVGLVIPHLMRMILGPAHGPLLFASLMGGAVLLLTADLVARTAVPNADLPIGMLTSLVGGPFFFWMLRRTRKRSGGWA